MKQKLAMVIDSSKCFNCKACLISCQLENELPVEILRNWVKRGFTISGQKLHFQPGNCMHCDNPTCVDACPTGATYKDDADGVVKVNRNLCIGCESCIPACPYNARSRHPVLGTVDKCDYCEDRRHNNKVPACVETCPTQARLFGDLADPTSEVSRQFKNGTLIRVINTETDTKPTLFYQNETAPLDWPTPAYVPDQISIWRDVARPFVKGVVGLSGIGVVAMFLSQLLTKDQSSNREEAKE